MHEPALPQSLPPPPHFGLAASSRRRATCPANLKGEARPASDACATQGTTPLPDGRHSTQKSLPKGSIYDHPMQYMIVLPESRASQGRSSRVQSMVGQTGVPGWTQELQGSCSSRRQRQQSMLEEKLAELQSREPERSHQQSHISGTELQSVASHPHGGSVGTACRKSVVEAKRSQQRQWHQELQRVRQMEEAGTQQLRRREEQPRSDQWSELKLQEQQLRSKEFQVQEVHQRMRTAAGPPAAQAELPRALQLPVQTSDVDPGGAKSKAPTDVRLQANGEAGEGQTEGRRAGRQTLHSCQVLGVSPDDGPDLIQQQYRRSALRDHPDKGGSHDQFTQLQAARDYMETRQSNFSRVDTGRLQGEELEQRRALSVEVRLHDAHQHHLEALEPLKAQHHCRCPQHPALQGQPPSQPAIAEAANLSAAPPLSTSASSSPKNMECMAKPPELTAPPMLQDSRCAAAALPVTAAKEERAINLKPKPPPRPTTPMGQMSTELCAVPAETPKVRKDAEHYEMMVDLTGEMPVHIATSRPSSQSLASAKTPTLRPPREEERPQPSIGLASNARLQNAALATDAPPPPLAPPEQPSQSWDTESEDVSDVDGLGTDIASFPTLRANHSSRRSTLAVSKAERSMALPPAPTEKVAFCGRDAVRVEPPRQRQPSIASQAPSSEGETAQTPKRRSPGWHTLDSCEVLGVTPDDGYESIQKQYRRQALRHHPDKGGRASLFRHLHDARDYLSSKQTRWQRAATTQTRPPPREAARPDHEAKDSQRSDALEELASEHSSVDMAESKSRRWQRMTGSTEYPASSLRRTSSTISDDGTLGNPSPVSAPELREAFSPHGGRFEDDGETDLGLTARAPAAATWRHDLQNARHEDGFELQGAPRVQWSRQALESSVHTHLRTMDAHCAALTRTYHQLASLHGELGQAFVDLRHAWAPLHDEAAV